MEGKNPSVSTVRQQPELRSASFEEVLPVWKNKLWPQRKSIIREVSPIQMDLSYDSKLLLQNAYFLVLENRRGIIGTISGYSTGEHLFRIRGLYIDPDYRGLGLSHALLRKICGVAQSKGAKEVWSIPRKSAWGAYKSFGFYQVSDWIMDGMEFGPNCIARRPL